MAPAIILEITAQAAPRTRVDPSARVAYICARYPAISHTFVMREVAALRRRGVHVETFTVRRTPRAELLTRAEVEEDAATQALLPASPSRLARAVAGCLAQRGGAVRLAAAAARAWQLRRPGVRGTLWQAFYLAEAVLLADLCRRARVRHVHAHFANVASDVALLARIIGSTPAAPWSWSFTMHGSADFWNVDALRLPEKATDATFVSCISNFARSQLMAFTAPEVWPRLHVVRCGLEAARVAPREPAASIGTPEQPARILHVGRLAAVKGQTLLVDLVGELRDRGLAVELTIVGDGPSRAAIEREIARRGLEAQVTLTGALGQDRVATLFARADLFVLTSFAEGVPVVAMEAMASGVPVVATRVAGIPELIEDGVSGRLAGPGRLDELVDAVDELINDPELRALCARNAAATVRDRFDVDVEAGHLAVLFDTTPSRRREPVLEAAPTGAQ